MIWSVYPGGVQRGTTTVVTVDAGGSEGGGGGNVYRAYKALFAGDGVTAEIVPPEKGWPAPDPKKPNEVPVVDHVQMRVTVAANARLGIHEFRIGTPIHGISTVGQLVVGDEPEVMEKEPNNDLEHAQTVPVPCVVNGRFQDAEDVDTFKFHAAAGQEIVFAVLCARLEDHVHDLNVHADPLLVLRDAAGAELARNDDYYGADPLLPYKFEKAGDFVVAIRDVTYGGNAHWVYRLTITSRPYVTTMVPCAVRPGKRTEVRVRGFNLEGAQTATVEAPVGIASGIWETPLTFPTGTSNVVRMLVTSAPQTAVTPLAPTTQPAVHAVTAAANSPQPVPIVASLGLPGGVNSWLAVPGRPDRYAFHGKKGTAWVFEVTARRLDSQIDSELRIRNAKGEVQASNDDAIGKDSRIEWGVPEDGDYTIDVSDVAGNGGPTYFYNLTAEPMRPDFALKIDADRAMISPDNRTSLYVLVDRKNGFGSEVATQVSGLPSGVTASPLTIPANVSVGAIVLTAAPGAKPDCSLIQVTGTAQVPGPDGKPVATIRTAHPMMEIYSPGGGRSQLETGTAGVSVVERADVEVTTNTKTLTLAPGGTAKIEITLKRRPGYAKPVTLDIMVQHLGTVFSNPLPPGVTVDDGASKTLLGENETEGWITLKAAGDSQAVKDLPLTVMANVSINFVMKVWYSTPVFTLTVNVPPKK